MVDSLSLRRYRPEDAEAVWDVHEAALRASPLAFVEDAAADEDITEIETEYLDAGGEFLVGELEGDVTEIAAGPTTASGIVAVGGYLPVDDRTMEIRRMRVHPEYQRRGFAGSLLSELEARAVAADFDRAELETVETLRAARRFYENAGYAVVEEWVMEQTGVPRYRYRKSLE